MSHCPTCQCSVAGDTRIFTRYDAADDKREPQTHRTCTSCRQSLAADTAVTVTYSSGAKRYYCTSHAVSVLGWNGEWTSTLAERLIIARAQMEAEVITPEQFAKIFDEVSG